MKKPETGGTQSIGRAATILRAVAASSHSGFGLGEIAAQTGIEKPTTHRILRRLIDESLLIQDPSTRAYHLGPLLYELGLAAAPSVPAQQLCSEALSELSRITGDSSFLMVRSGEDSVCLDRQEGHFPIKVLALGVGQRRPLGSGAGSIALMGLLPDDQIDEILHSNADRLLARGEPTVNEFRAMVRKARSAGYATKDAPDLPVRSLSIAIRDVYGNGLCALSITSLTVRVEQRHSMLIETLRSITDELGQKIRGSITREQLASRYAS